MGGLLGRGIPGRRRFWLVFGRGIWCRRLGLLVGCLVGWDIFGWKWGIRMDTFDDGNTLGACAADYEDDGLGLGG